MNSRIISACMNPGTLVENDIKREIVKEIINEYLSCDEVVYDGKVISIYDLDKVMNEKMDYVKYLSCFNNYVIDEYLEYKALGFRVIGDSWSYFSFNEDSSLFLNFVKVGSMGFSKKSLEVNIYLEDGNILYEIKNYYFWNKPLHKVNLSLDDAREFVDVFINDNREMLLELLGIIKSFGNNFDKGFYKGFKEVIKENNYGIYLTFDLKTKGIYNFFYFYDSNDNLYDIGKLDLIEFFNDKKDALFKRISINMEELNPFFRNEIDRYYNSINLLDYKCYKRKK